MQGQKLFSFQKSWERSLFSKRRPHPSPPVSQLACTKWKISLVSAAVLIRGFTVSEFCISFLSVIPEIQFWRIHSLIAMISSLFHCYVINYPMVMSVFAHRWCQLSFQDYGSIKLTMMSLFVHNNTIICPNAMPAFAPQWCQHLFGKSYERKKSIDQFSSAILPLFNRIRNFRSIFSPEI